MHVSGLPDASKISSSKLGSTLGHRPSQDVLCPSFCRVETLTAKLQMHESHFKEFDRLAGRVKLVEESLNHIPGVLRRLKDSSRGDGYA